MRLFYSPQRDASIYQDYQWKNTGRDEILEVGKTRNGIDSIRSLIQFNMSAISQSIVTTEIPLNAEFDLILYVAHAEELNDTQQIDLHPISRSWVEGTGYYYQNTTSHYTSSREPSSGYYEDNGVTWKQRSTGSYWTTYGGEYFSSSASTTLNIDVINNITFSLTSTVRSWLSGTYANNGVLIKYPDTDESSSYNIGIAKFFSKQSHTIYAPVLVAKWDSQLYLTGSTTSSQAITNLSVFPNNLQASYFQNEIVRVNLTVKDKYPQKTFDTLYSGLGGSLRLSSASYFSIIDVGSNAAIIPFDDYSKISCDGSNTYIEFSTNGMYPGRYYGILIKTISGTSTRIYSSQHRFTISNQTTYTQE